MFPTPVVNTLCRSALVGEDELRVLAPLFVDDSSGDRIEYDDAFLTVLSLELVNDWQDKHAGIQLRHLDLPVPAQLQYLLLAAAGVSL